MRVDYFPLSTVGNDTRCCVGAGVLCGLAFTNTSTTDPATVTIFDGADSNGRQIVTFALAAGGLLTGSLAHDGVTFGYGVFIATGGGVTGSVFAALDALQ